MVDKEFRKSEAVTYGWEAMKKNLGFFLIFQLVVFALYALVQSLTDSAKEGGFPSGPADLIRLVVYFSVTMVWIWTALRIHDAKDHGFADLFSNGRRILNYLAVEFIYSCIVFAGLILLVVPAFIWGIQFGYARFAVLDEGLGPIEALHRSSSLTRGGRNNLFLFGLLLFGINMLGLLALFVGVFATLPTTVVAMAWAYRELQQRTAQEALAPGVVGATE